MESIITRSSFWVWMTLLVGAVQSVLAATQDLGKGFRDHGVATPISNSRGTVATQDGQGRDIVLSWLFDHRGGYALLLAEADTGKSETYPVPFNPGGDCPYASILSSANKYYTHFNSFFVEFDPAKRAFTFWQQTAPQMAMSMTEDDRGRIWSATYPQSGLVCFDPATRKLRDYGHLYQQDWAQYPRSVAADRDGWIYFGIGSTRGQIIAFDPETGTGTPVIPEEQRRHGYAPVYRDLDGEVYGLPTGDKKDGWLAFDRGQAARIGSHQEKPKPYIAGSQGLSYRDFPDGRRIRNFDLVDRVLTVEDPKAGRQKTVHFDYPSEGASIMGLAVAPDETICGGTAFPMRFFAYDPAKDTWVNREAYGQWNTLARQGERFFAGGYTGGFLLEWDPLHPWVPTEPGRKDSNPRFLTRCAPAINRPHRLLAHPDGRTLVLAGTPDYGLTGGGMLIWDRRSKKGVLLTHTDLLPEQATMSLAALPKGKLLAGTTTSPGTGGQRKAKEAELYILDLATRQVEWHQAVFPRVQEYTDLCPGADGKILGFADQRRFFVFDPVQRKVIHDQSTGSELGLTPTQQGPRVFVPGKNGEIYILFVKGIAQVDLKAYSLRMLAESPAPIGGGGDYLNGRIYFLSGSHVYSWEVQ